MLHEPAHQAHETLGLRGRRPRAPVVGQLAVHRVQAKERAHAGDAPGDAGLPEAIVEARAQLGPEVGELS